MRQYDCRNYRECLSAAAKKSDLMTDCPCAKYVHDPFGIYSDTEGALKLYLVAYINRDAAYKVRAEKKNVVRAWVKQKFRTLNGMATAAGVARSAIQDWLSGARYSKRVGMFAVQNGCPPAALTQKIYS